MNEFKKFIGEVKNFFDEEKRLLVQKNTYQRKIDKIKNINKARKELEQLKKELDTLENGNNPK